MDKKYAIVRVDGQYKPSHFEVNSIEDISQLKLIDQIKDYGDVKEQLIRKVAQIRFRQETQYGSKDMLKAIYNMCYRQAKEIVEFLGVK